MGEEDKSLLKLMNLISKLNTARSMPPKHLAEMLARHANRKLRRYYIRLFPVTLSANRFFRLTANFNPEEQPPFFFHLGDKDIIAEAIKKDSHRDHRAHRGKILGALGVLCGRKIIPYIQQELGKEIDWHLDFKTGFRWNPKTYYLGTRKHITLDDDSDVKVPWELSRCQHFVTIGKAYWYIKQSKMQNEKCKIDGEKYARESDRR